MFSKITVPQHKLGLWFRRGSFHRLLTPGVYRFRSGIFNTADDSVELVNTTATRFEHPLLDVLIQQPELQTRLLVVEVGDNQRGLLFKSGRLQDILIPGRYAFWRNPSAPEVRICELDSLRLDPPTGALLARLPNADLHVKALWVQSHERVILHSEQSEPEVLGPGLHVFWKVPHFPPIEHIDLREQLLDVTGQEIMTSDKVTVRVNLLASYRIVDPRKAAGSVVNLPQAIYREAQLALRDNVASHTLDELLAQREILGQAVRAKLEARVADYGVAVGTVGVRDISVPAAMREILNKVIIAEREAQANLIKRREETAAARSQVNTARLLQDNPALVRLRELEIVQEILSGNKSVFVFGGGGDLVSQVRNLVES